MLTVHEAARVLGLNPKTVERWLRSGKLDGSKIGRHWRVDRATLENMLSTVATVARVVDRGREVVVTGFGGDSLVVSVDGRPVKVIDGTDLYKAIQTIATATGSQQLTVEIPQALLEGGGFGDGDIRTSLGV